MKNSDVYFEHIDPSEYSSKLLYKLISMNQLRVAKDKLDIATIQKAVYYAKKYHADQTRASGEPYYYHPLEVAYMLAEYAAEDNKQYFKTELFVSSILHDTIEDTILTKEMISAEFGAVVANQVEGLTRVKAHGKITSEELVRSLVKQGNKEVLMIKMFDRLHNIQTIKAKSPEKIKKIINETIRVFLLLSVYLDAPYVKNILIRLCYQHLDLKHSIYYLACHKSVFSINNYQLSSLEPQNDVAPVDTPGRLAT